MSSCWRPVSTMLGLPWLWSESKGVVRFSDIATHLPHTKCTGVIHVSLVRTEPSCFGLVRVVLVCVDPPPMGFDGLEPLGIGLVRQGQVGLQPLCDRGHPDR